MALDTESTEEEMDDIDFIEEVGRFESIRESRLLWMVGGLALGIAAMYLLDPADGGRRRTSLSTKVKDLTGPLYKMATERKARMSEEATRH